MKDMKAHKAEPTKVVSKTITSVQDAVLDLMHPKHKTMVMYKSKDGQHRITAVRRTGSKTWILVDGKVVRTTQIRALVGVLASL